MKCYLLIQPHKAVRDNIIDYLVTNSFIETGIAKNRIGSNVLVVVKPTNTPREDQRSNDLFVSDHIANIVTFCDDVVTYTNIAEFLKAVLTNPQVESPSVIVAGVSYTAKFDKGCVRFGCATIENKLLRKAYELCQHSTTCAFTGVTHVKFGKGEFTKPLLEKIIKHPAFKD